MALQRSQTHQQEKKHVYGTGLASFENRLTTTYCSNSKIHDHSPNVSICFPISSPSFPHVTMSPSCRCLDPQHFPAVPAVLCGAAVGAGGPSAGSGAAASCAARDLDRWRSAERFRMVSLGQILPPKMMEINNPSNINYSNI